MSKGIYDLMVEMHGNNHPEVTKLNGTDMLKAHFEKKHKDEMNALLEKQRQELATEPSIRYKNLSLHWNTSKHTVTFVDGFHTTVIQARDINGTMEYKRERKITIEEYHTLSELIFAVNRVHRQKRDERLAKKNAKK